MSGVVSADTEEMIAYFTSFTIILRVSLANNSMNSFCDLGPK